MLAVKLVPAELMAEFRGMADGRADRPVSRTGLAIIVGI